MNSPQRKLVRVQEKGQVALPVDVRNRLGIKKGDLVAVMDADDGIFIARQEVLATRALDRIGDLLREQGLSLAKLIESGRVTRGRVIEERYGLPSDTQD